MITGILKSIELAVRAVARRGVGPVLRTAQHAAQRAPAAQGGITKHDIFLNPAPAGAFTDQSRRRQSRRGARDVARSGKRGRGSRLRVNVRDGGSDFGATIAPDDGFGIAL